MARVTIVVLGGTITMLPQASGGIAPSIDGKDLIAAVPELSAVADISVVTPFLVPGASLSLPQVADVAALVAAAGRDGADGVVVVQGTDTIDEVGFLLDIGCPTGVGHPSIVITGAMRGAAAPGADGHANLLSAASVAASPMARGLGALVVLDEEVHSARFVQKMDTALPSAFSSPGLGPVGIVAEGEFRVRMVPVAMSLPPLDVDHAAPVAIVQVGLGDDGRLLEAVGGFGYRGAVVAAMGGGHVPLSIVPKLEALSAMMPVVLSTRVPGGAVFEKSYGFPGSEMDLLARGLVPSGLLPPHKARLLLACLIGGGFSAAEIATHFRAFA